MMPAPLKTFIIYARADAQFKDELLTHLHPFVRNGLLQRWVDSDLLPGEEWEKRIEKELDAAHLVIMLVSADALNSDFIEKKELKIALDKKRAGAARVVPILVRDCFWEMHPDLSALQLLPKHENGEIRGVAGWTSHDSAWTHCLRELKKLIDEIHTALQKEMEAAETARIAEELKKQQSAEAEKTERGRNRLDEAFWKKTNESLIVAQEVQEKIDFLNDYLQDATYLNHRIEAEEQIEKLRAELAAEQKIKEAQERREAERRRREQEAARLAEQARQEKIEREKRQKAEAEQQTQKAYRLKKQDEIAWKAALAAIKKAKTEWEKMNALEVYLDEPEHKTHRGEAEKQFEELKAAETARKIEEKQREQQRLEAARAERAEQDRLQKQDEIDWNATLEAIDMVKTEEEKIYFLEKYLDEPEHKIHRVEAEQQLEILKAAETARRLEEKQRLEADRKKRAAEQAERDRKAQEVARLAELKKQKEAKKDPLEMVLVRGGTFQMGGNNHDNEKPIHSVKLPDFEIGKYPVTQKFWQEIMGNNPSDFNGCDDCPVENVSWEDVQGFLKKLNQKYLGKNYRLPSEAEWEYAARGGQQSKGYPYAGSNNIDEVAWYDKNLDEITHPVGNKKANELGIYDMSGNVWEWCQDAWHDNYQGATVDGSAWESKNKYGPRVLRGGSWFSSDYYCRSSSRIRYGCNVKGNYIGFRLARH